MSKNDIFLQIFFIVLTSALISLLALKFYPQDFLKERKASAASNQSLVKPVPETNMVEEAVQSFLPAFISIPSIKMNLIVAPGVIVNNEWTLFDDKISWLSTSDTPGQGNVILYGHNRVGLFGDLKKLSIGDEIRIKDNSGKEYLYEVTETRKVLPSDTDAIISDKNQLTLYTCDGTFDQKRLVVIALPKK